MRFFIVIIISVFSNYSFAQNSDGKYQNDIYVVALKKYVSQLKEIYTTDFYSENKKQIIYIKDEKYLDKIPGKIDNYKIVRINDLNKDKYFKNRKPRLLTTIFPLKNKDGKCFINITPYQVTSEKNNYVQTVSDWTIVYFKNKNGIMVYDRIENGGI